MSDCITISVIKDIVLSGAAITTAYVAYTGIEKWKAELTGKANFEVARALIRSIYKLRDEIGYCRSPFTFAYEFPEGAQGGLANLSPEQKGEAWAHVYGNRWEPVGNALQAFDSETLEAEALWGSEIKEKAQVLRRLARELQTSMEAFIRNEYSNNEDFKDREFGKKVRANVSAGDSKDDELSVKIRDAIEELEKVIRPHLARS